MSNRLKIVVMTQSDRFFIPHNIRLASEVCDIAEIVQVNCKSSLDNKLSDYLDWFGFFECAKMGARTTLRALSGICDRLSGYRFKGGECSVSSVAAALGIPFSEIEDSNSPEFVERMKALSPDLIISYSAPQVIKAELLSIPKHGFINVHGSLLPHYRGCLPSFWYLYNEEKVGGATVHYMSEKIDDGDILRQDTVDISDCRSMFSLIRKTKKLGGELMAATITDITNGTVNRSPNNTESGSYFTWPTKKQAREFLKKGYRFA